MFFGIAVGSNFFKRKRTLCVDLSDLNQAPYKPPYPDIFTQFLKNDVGLDLTQVESVSVHPLAPYCMFKLKTNQYHDTIDDKIVMMCSSVMMSLLKSKCLGLALKLKLKKLELISSDMARSLGM